MDALPAYGLLSVAQQWELHAFYQPSRQVDFDEFKQHVLELHHSKPSLANRVGKHFRILESVYLEFRGRGLDLSDPQAFNLALTPYLAKVQLQPIVSKDVVSTPPKPPGHKLIVSAVARPELDLNQLARAVQLLEEVIRREEDPWDKSSAGGKKRK